MRGMKEEERGREMDRESDDFEERGERVMVFFCAEWASWFQSRDGCLTFEREKTLVNGQYKLKLTMYVSHDTRTSVTKDCCHLILFAAILTQVCRKSLSIYIKVRFYLFIYLIFVRGGGEVGELKDAILHKHRIFLPQGFKWS